MPKDIANLIPQYHTEKGTIRFDTFFRMGWRPYDPKTPNRKSNVKGKDMPTVGEVAEIIKQFEAKYPKQNPTLNWDSHQFDLKGGTLHYGEWQVSHKFLYDFCATYAPRAGHDSFYRLMDMDEQFALDYINKFIPQTSERINQSIKDVKIVGKAKGWSKARIKGKIDKIKESGNCLVMRQQEFGTDLIARAWNSQHFTQYKDSQLLIDMIEDTPAIAKMAVFDCRLRENDLMIRFTPKKPTQVTTLKPYEVITITNPELGGRSIYGEGGLFEPTCWNGMNTYSKELTIKQIHRGKFDLNLGQRIPMLLKEGKKAVKLLQTGKTALFEPSQGLLDELFMRVSDGRREKETRKKIESGFPTGRDLFVDRHLRKIFTKRETGLIKDNLDSKALTAPKHSLSRVVQAITLTAQDQPNRREWELEAYTILGANLKRGKKPTKITRNKKLVISV